MKKAVSLILAAVLVSSTVVPAFAQKRLASTSKKQPTKTETTQFETFAAYTDGSGVWLSWRMVAEIGNIGFNVYRVDNGKTELITPVKFITGAATHGRELPSYGESYTYLDRGAAGTAAYYIEAFGLDGKRVNTGQVYPQYVSSLESFTGLSQNELAARSASEPASLEKSILTYTKEIANEMSESAIVPDLNTHKAVISTPGAVRIGVNRDGLHRVTRAQLEGAGFDASGDSALWQLYVDGIQQAIIVGSGAQYIEFYGKGVDTNETDVRRYYLINGTAAGKRIENRVATTTTSTVVTPSYLQTFVYKERLFWVDDIINGDADNYFGRFISNTSNNPLAFNLSGVDFGAPSATLRLRFQGYSFSSHSVEVILNNETLAPATTPDEGEVVFDATYFVPTSFLREGANSIKFRSLTAGDTSYFDSMSIDFSRKYLARNNATHFYTQNYRKAKLGGFTSANVRVFDVTRESEPVLMTNLDFQADGPTFGVDIPANRGRSFYAVEDSAVLPPESVTSNNPDLLSLPTNGADLIIIYHKDFQAGAQAWANYRMNQGIPVKLVDVTDIFDEYNYGSLSALSIKSFLADAYTNWVNKPEYVLLIGDASWDSRNWEGVGFFNYVPSPVVSTAFTDTSSDEALADFDNDGLASIAIGRIPARTPAHVTTMFNKTVAWESQTQDPMGRGALFAYDVNNGYPFDLMSQSLRDRIPSVDSTLIVRVPGNYDLNRQNLATPINTGKMIVNYSGHGSAGSWNADFLRHDTIEQSEFINHNPSIYTMLTCLNGFFHWLYNPSLAEILTLREGRGAVAAWASSAKTTPDVQAVMALRFFTKLNDGTYPRLGDMVKDAKGTLEGYGADVRLSWAIIGDPMLVVRPGSSPRIESTGKTGPAGKLK